MPNDKFGYLLMNDTVIPYTYVFHMFHCRILGILEGRSNSKHLYTHFLCNVTKVEISFFLLLSHKYGLRYANYKDILIF